MELIKEIQSLPETIPPDELNSLFKRLISESISANDSIKIAVDLADKQWHNYSLMEEKLRGEIDDFVVNLLQANLSIKNVQDIGMVIGYIGLSKSYDKLKSLSKDTTLSNETLKEIESIILDLGPSVENPYKDFWNPNNSVVFLCVGNLKL